MSSRGWAGIETSGIMLAREVIERPHLFVQLADGEMLDVPAPEVDLTTIEGIEMVGVGMDWPGLNGPSTITEQDIRQAKEILAWAIYYEATRAVADTIYYDEREVECWRRLKATLKELGISYKEKP